MAPFLFIIIVFIIILFFAIPDFFFREQCSHAHVILKPCFSSSCYPLSSSLSSSVVPASFIFPFSPPPLHLFLLLLLFFLFALSSSLPSLCLVFHSPVILFTIFVVFLSSFFSSSFSIFFVSFFFFLFFLLLLFLLFLFLLVSSMLKPFSWFDCKLISFFQ